MICDTINDELFINSPTDSEVMPKFLYICFLAGDPDHTRPEWDITIKYEYTITRSLAHISNPVDHTPNGDLSKIHKVA
jgi:hypothetical protein